MERHLCKKGKIFTDLANILRCQLPSSRVSSKKPLELPFQTDMLKRVPDPVWQIDLPTNGGVTLIGSETRDRVLTCILACGIFGGTTFAQQAVLEPPAAVDSSASVSDLLKTKLPTYLKTSAPKDLQDAKLLEKRVKELMDVIRPCTVSVSGGSGVVISPDGYVLTVAHVNQRPGRTVTLTFPDGRRVRGKTLGNNHGIDAGLIKITTEGKWPFAKMGRSDDLEVGEWCVASGFPVSFESGKQPAVRLGRIQRHSSRSIVTDCTIMGGDSGGPLFDLDGNVIGINSRVSGSVKTNIHVPVDSYSDTWDRLADSENWSDRSRRRGAYLGVSWDPEDERVLIERVTTDSPAEKAGIRAGDIITNFDGRKIKDFNDLLQQIARKKPKDSVSIRVQRESEILELNATLGSWPKR